MADRILLWLRRAALVALVVDWALMFGGTHVPIPPENVLNVSDKALHFSGFWTLSFLLVAVLTLRTGATWRRFALTLAILAAYGAADEWTQPIVGRDCDFYDWVADVCGCAGGTLLGLAAVTAVRQTVRKLAPHAPPPQGSGKEGDSPQSNGSGT